MVDEQRAELYDHDDPLVALHASTAGEIVELTGHTMLPPVHAPEIWCAGVTYERSRDARLEEAQTEARDVYSLVYDADRPELFPRYTRALMRRSECKGFAREGHFARSRCADSPRFETRAGSSSVLISPISVVLPGTIAHSSGSR